jgi:hypothetical protein
MARTLLHKQEKGHLGQYEDWWYLDENADGTQQVHHEWDHVSVRGLARTDDARKYTIEEFLDGDHNHIAKSKLREILGT